ncbi:hypothetical protein ACFL0P_06205 [Candidatus Omnitrophota bacterium]
MRKSEDRYKGEFNHGLMHGKGIYTWVRGNNKYEGEFRNNKMVGQIQ